MRISCPPTISPCYYGVDTPNKSGLIAASLSIEEIRDFIEADLLGYLSLDGIAGSHRNKSELSVRRLLERKVSNANHQRGRDNAFA